MSTLNVYLTALRIYSVRYSVPVGGYVVALPLTVASIFKFFRKIAKVLIER